MMSRLCRLITALELGICEALPTSLNLCEKRGQFGAIKLPLKRGWALVGKLFVQGQPEPDRFQISKVIRGQHLALDD